MNITSLEEKAIDAAVNADWPKAIEINKSILKFDKENIDACLRLAYSLLQSNHLADARKAFHRALRIQPKNLIAIEHLEKISVLESKKKNKVSNVKKFDPDLFIESPGRTKAVRLTNLGQKEDIAGRTIGETLILKEKKRHLEVRSIDGDYIGTLPDDISKRMIYFIKSGSSYEAFVKDYNFSEVTVFIREVKKGRKVRKYPSFPANSHVMLSDIAAIGEDQTSEEGHEIGADDDTSDPSGEISEDATEEEEGEEDWEESLDSHKELEGIVSGESDEDEEE